MTRITITPIPFNTEGSRTLRTRTKVDETTSSSNEFETAGAKKTPLEWLQYGLRTQRHEKKGWLKHELTQAGELKEDKSMIWDHVMAAYQCQLSCIEGMKTVSESDFVHPRQYRGTQGHQSGDKSGHTEKPPHNPLPVTCLRCDAIVVPELCEGWREGEIFEGTRREEGKQSWNDSDRRSGDG